MPDKDPDPSTQPVPNKKEKYYKIHYTLKIN